MRISLLLIVLLFPFIAPAQSINYYASLDQNDNDFKEDSTLLKYRILDVESSKRIKSKDSALLMHREVLNVFIAKTVNSFFSSGSHLSLSKNYAFLDNSDGRLFIGGTIGSQNDNRKKKTHLLQLGLKASVKDNFANLKSEGKWSNDIGGHIKYTFLGNGIINQTSPESIFNKKLRVFGREKVDEMNKERIEKLKKYKQTIAKDTVLTYCSKLSELKSFLKETNSEYAEKYVEYEYENLVNRKLYKFAFDYWISLDAYIPFTKSVYNTASTTLDLEIFENGYRPYEFRVLPSMIWTSPAGGKAYFGLIASIFQNNSVKTEDLKKVDFEKYILQNNVDTLNLALLESKNVYIGNFDKSSALRYGFQASYFLPGKLNFTGISFEMLFERPKNDFNSPNWKIGVPFSLKDNEGKSKINFELQYRKQYKDKSFGISVGLPFGDYI